MTFGEAQTSLRNDVLAEASTDYYSDADLFGFLKQAAQEIALDFGFPTAVSTASVVTDASSFSLPADSANVDLNEVSFDGFRLLLQPYATVQAAVDQTSIGVPRYYNFDPKRGGVVFFAPKAPRNGVIKFEYVQNYDVSGVTTGSVIWDGLFVPFHNLVVFSAGVKAFDASLEQERAGYWLQRYQARSQEFAAFLNKTPLNKLVVEEVAPS